MQLKVRLNINSSFCHEAIVIHPSKIAVVLLYQWYRCHTCLNSWVDLRPEHCVLWTIAWLRKSGKCWFRLSVYFTSEPGWRLLCRCQQDIPTTATQPLSSALGVHDFNQTYPIYTATGQQLIGSARYSSATMRRGAGPPGAVKSETTIIEGRGRGL